MERRPLAVDASLAAASTLPSWCYADPAVAAAEATRVFARTWQLVGTAASLAEPGSYRVTEIAGEPVLVVRGKDGVLRALSNVCRHRAGPVASGSGTCATLRCGYHGWSYGLDGALAGTPEFDGVEGFDRGSTRLPVFRVETWIGLVFVCLTGVEDGGPPPLAEVLGELHGRLEARGLARLSLAFRRDWEIACDWKVYVDNYLEGYHIPVVHPGLMKELDYRAYRTETHGRWSIQHAPIVSAGGRLRRREDDSEAAYYWVFPNLMLNVYPDNYSTNLILPLGPGRTLTVFEWYVADPESPAVRRVVEETVAFSDEVQHEDIAICEAVQRGLRSRTYSAGRFSVRRENGVHHFHRLYADAMAGVSL